MVIFRFLLLIFFSFSFLYSKIIEARYKIAYGIFGEIGYANATFKKSNDEYMIKIDAKATKIAKILSKNREEEYMSRGIVVDGILRPKIYKKIRKNSYKKIIKTYKFDHEKKIIEVFIERYKNNRLVSKNSERLKYYAKDDILTLYFNLKKYLNERKEDSLIFFAVGGNKEDGKVDVRLPKDKELKRLKSLFHNEDGLYIDVVIHQKIFASKEGRLHIVIDQKLGVAKRAILEDVIFFGDIVAKLDRLNYED